MLAPLLITLRETLEASLVVGIILAMLNRTESKKYISAVWSGVAAATVASLVLAWAFESYFGGFTGRAEELYEGIMMLSAAGLITWMILWMLRQGARMKDEIEGRVSSHIESHYPLGIFLLTFISVAREGIETVIFLQAAFIQSQAAYHNIGAVLGIVIAISVSYLFFKGMYLFPLKKFFLVTSVILILFAAGLVAHGVHELEEAGVIPVLVEHVWDTNGLLSEDGTVGSLLKALFGYNGNPSLGEVLSYGAYLVLIGTLWRTRMKRPVTR